MSFFSGLLLIVFSVTMLAAADPDPATHLPTELELAGALAGGTTLQEVPAGPAEWGETARRLKEEGVSWDAGAKFIIPNRDEPDFSLLVYDVISPSPSEASARFKQVHDTMIAKAQYSDVAVLSPDSVFGADETSGMRLDFFDTGFKTTISFVRLIRVGRVVSLVEVTKEFQGDPQEGPRDPVGVLRTAARVTTEKMLVQRLD